MSLTLQAPAKRFGSAQPGRGGAGGSPGVPVRPLPPGGPGMGRGGSLRRVPSPPPPRSTVLNAGRGRGAATPRVGPTERGSAAQNGSSPLTSHGASPPHVGTLQQAPPLDQ